MLFLPYLATAILLPYICLVYLQNIELVSLCCLCGRQGTLAGPDRKTLALEQARQCFETKDDFSRSCGMHPVALHRSELDSLDDHSFRAFNILVLCSLL